MKKLYFIFFVFFIVSGLNLKAYAITPETRNPSFSIENPDIELGMPGYGGSGCPAGSASVILSSDKKSISVVFDQYKVEAGGGTGRTIDRQFCGLTIPVHVPQGISVSLKSMKLQGYASIPHGTSGSFHSEYFFAGTSGPAYVKDFSPGFEGSFELNDSLPAAETIWSACGQSVNLRINTSIIVKGDETSDHASLTLSGSPNGDPMLQLQWRECH